MSTTTPLLTRLIDAYRRTTASRTAVALVLANAIPLVGVLFFGWSLWTILVLYWVENGIVGVWNIPRILLAQGALLPGKVGVGYRPWAVAKVPPVGRTGLAVFFVIHYGLFWLVHGVFVLVIPAFMGASGGSGTVELVPLFPGDPGSPLVPGPEPVGAFGAIDWAGVAVAGVGLFLSHAASFAFNYISRGDYRTVSAAAQMLAPYGRLVVLHMTILLGGFAIAFLGAPIGMLLLLVILKTGLDLAAQLRSDRPLFVAVPQAS